MTDATFALGIDLGTTNSALASVPMANKTDSPKPLAIPQTVAPGETMAENLLPSFLYMSAEAERAPGAFSLPWREANEQVVGTYARSKVRPHRTGSFPRPRAGSPTAVSTAGSKCCHGKPPKEFLRFPLSRLPLNIWPTLGQPGMQPTLRAR